MDTTVALFFSLGIVMSPADKPVPSVQEQNEGKIIAQSAIKPNQKVIERHQLVKGRIAATNAWLANQRTQRRALAKKQHSIQLSINTHIQSCSANWNLT